MITLERIRLVNWHNFTGTVIEIGLLPMEETRGKLAMPIKAAVEEIPLYL